MINTSDLFECVHRKQLNMASVRDNESQSESNGIEKKISCPQYNTAKLEEKDEGLFL